VLVALQGRLAQKGRKRWTAKIQKDRVDRRLGTFSDEIAAAQAYDEAARDLFGEHARLNFPDGIDARLEEETTPQRNAAWSEPVTKSGEGEETASIAAARLLGGWGEMIWQPYEESALHYRWKLLFSA
jgi:hypothetical protein